MSEDQNTQDTVSNDDDDDFVRAIEIKRHAQPIVDRFIKSSKVVTDMYDECYNTEDDVNMMSNPMVISQVIDRVLEQIKPLDKIYRIPNSTKEERQILRDAANQIEDESGFISCLRDDQRGFLSLASTGNTILHFGTSQDENDSKESQKETPIRFRCLSISQCYFPTYATQLRSQNGDNDANEAFIIFEFPESEVLQKYPQAKGKILWGNLPQESGEDMYQNAEDDENRSREKITQVGIYYNKIKKINKVFIGRTAYLAVDQSGDKYKWVLDGKAYIPLIWLRAKKLVGKLYGVGVGHQHVKIAREDQRRRNMAFRHVENNVFPTRGVRMAEDKFGIFLGQMFEAAEIRKDGGDPIVRFEPDDPGKIETLGSDPLTQEWERLNLDTTEQVKRNGIAIQDVDRPATQTATQTLSEERAKTRLTVQIGENNASEYKFAYRVIIDFMRRFIKLSNDTPVATNVKLTLTEDDVVAAKGLPESIGTQIESPPITLGQVAGYLRENKKVVIQEDSRSGAWETDALLMAKTTQKLQFGAGTQSEAGLRQEALGNLGEELLSQDLKPLPNETQPAGQLGSPQGLPKAPTPQQGILP